jgi:hypothetical protein
MIVAALTAHAQEIVMTVAVQTALVQEIVMTVAVQTALVQGIVMVAAAVSAAVVVVIVHAPVSAVVVAVATVPATNAVIVAVPIVRDSIVATAAVAAIVATAVVVLTKNQKKAYFLKKLELANAVLISLTFAKPAVKIISSRSRKARDGKMGLATNATKFSCIKRILTVLSLL